MKKLFLLLPFLLAACTGYPATQAPVVSAANADVVQASPVASRTSVPQITETPTVDTIGTAQADDMNARKTSEAVVLVIATSDAEKLQATNTAVVLTELHIQETVTAGPSATAAQNTAEAKAQAAQGTQVGLADLHATQTREYPAVILDAANAKAQADFAPVKAAGDAIGLLFASIAVACLAGAGAYFLIEWIRRWPAAGEEPETPNQLAVDPIHVPRNTRIQENRSNGDGYLEAMQADIPAEIVERSILLEVARKHINADVPLSYSDWVWKRKVFTETAFKKFIEYLKKESLARDVSPTYPIRGVRLTDDRGLSVFRALAEVPE